MLSAGMFSAFAAAMAVRKRGLPSGSPPPLFAAMLISLIRRVKILPRFASSAPFLCLIVAHFEWPDIVRPRIYKSILKILDGAGFAFRGNHRVASVSMPRYARRRTLSIARRLFTSGLPVARRRY